MTRDDFSSDQAYSDHLEMVENVIFALAYGEPNEVEEAQRFQHRPSSSSMRLRDRCDFSGPSKNSKLLIAIA